MARLSREQMRTKLCAMVRNTFEDNALADEAAKYIFSIYNKEIPRKDKYGKAKDPSLPTYAELEKMVKTKYAEKFEAIALAAELAKNKKKDEERKKAAEEAAKKPEANTENKTE